MNNPPKSYLALVRAQNNIRSPEFPYSWRIIRTDIHWQQWNEFVLALFAYKEKLKALEDAYLAYVNLPQKEREEIDKQDSEKMRRRRIQLEIISLEREVAINLQRIEQLTDSLKEEEE